MGALAVKSLCGLLSDTKLTFPSTRHLYSGLNAISHKVILQLHELVFDLSITRASVESTGHAEDEQLEHPLLPAGTGSLCSLALVSELGICAVATNPGMNSDKNVTAQSCSLHLGNPMKSSSGSLTSRLCRRTVL